MKVLFRAETIDQSFTEETESIKLINKKWYAIGDEVNIHRGYQIVEHTNCEMIECDYDTRAIHFEDMIDSETNLIFASLSEDGKGGDEINLTTVYQSGEIKTAMYFELGWWLRKEDGRKEYLIPDMLKEMKVTGIQE